MLFADMGWDEFMGLGIGFFLVCIIPLVAMLLRHQRSMAELLHRVPSKDDALQAKIDSLETEVRALRHQVNELIIRQDANPNGLSGRMATPPLPDTTQVNL